jgi:hypothetical protein
MINYLARRPAPIPFIVFLPVELAMVGEKAILAAFKKHPPDYVVIIDRPTPEYNVKLFGTDQDFGYLIMPWINNQYIPVNHISYELSNRPQFGINILRNREKGD